LGRLTKEFIYMLGVGLSTGIGKKNMEKQGGGDPGGFKERTSRFSPLTVKFVYFVTKK